MAVTTFTERQVVADMFPEYLTKRGVLFGAVIDALPKA